VAHRPAASSGAARSYEQLPPAPWMTLTCQRGGGLKLRQNWADQKIVHLRIVLKTRFA
jgi:hypothetical protein